MALAEKLLLVAGAGRSLYSGWRFQRIFSVLVTVAMLALIAAVMVCTIALGGFYALYMFLLMQAVQPLHALLITGLAPLVIMLIVLQAIRSRLRTLRSPLRAPVEGAVEAFFDGLLGK